MTLISQNFRNNKPLPQYFTDKKLKMSAVFIFEIKDAKKDKIFNFFKDSFFVIGAPMDMIFDLFSDIYVRLPKSITSQFFSRYSKNYINLNVKSCLKQRPLTSTWAALEPPHFMYLLQLYKCSLEWSL